LAVDDEQLLHAGTQVCVARLVLYHRLQRPDRADAPTATLEDQVFQQRPLVVSELPRHVRLALTARKVVEQDRRHQRHLPMRGTIHGRPRRDTERRPPIWYSDELCTTT